MLVGNQHHRTQPPSHKLHKHYGFIDQVLVHCHFILGGTQGLGLGVGLSLARLGASVDIAGRDEELANKAIATFHKLSPSHSRAVFRFYRVDLESIRDTKKFANEYLEQNRLHGLDYLVWSAGNYRSLACIDPGNVVLN